MCDGADDAVPDTLDMSLLARRFQEVRDAEVDRRTESLLTAAKNWRTGRCEQRTVCVLDEWIRRLKCANGVVAMGTYSGAVVLAELESGEVVERWASEAEEAMDRDDDDDDDDLDEYEEEYEELDGPLDFSTSQPYSDEVTAIDFDGERVGSGDASGRLRLRTRERGLVLSAQHNAPVTGVHWRDDARAYSCSADRRLCAWDVGGPTQDGAGDAAPAAALAARRPILCMSVCDGYAALGLASGEVCVVTLEPLRELFTFDAHADAVSAVHLTTTSTLTTGAADGEVAIWRLEEDEGSPRRCVRLEGHSAPVVALDADGEKIVSGARDGTVRVWDAEAAKLRFMLQGFTAYIGSVQADPSWLIADGTNNAVVLLDFAAETADDAFLVDEETGEWYYDDEDEDDDDDDDGGSLVSI